MGCVVDMFDDGGYYIGVRTAFASAFSLFFSLFFIIILPLLAPPPLIRLWKYLILMEYHATRTFLILWFPLFFLPLVYALHLWANGSISDDEFPRVLERVLVVPLDTLSRVCRVEGLGWVCFPVVRRVVDVVLGGG